jgi:pimeloyl-ACP methyl ester carboxylesterase
MATQRPDQAAADMVVDMAGGAPAAFQAPVSAITGAESYEGPDIAHIEFATGEGDPLLTLLWLPGSGQRADNEILRRLVNALHVCRVNSRIVGLRGPELVEHWLAVCAKRDAASRVVLGGHSMGGGAAIAAVNRLCAAASRAVCGVVTFNAAIAVAVDAVRAACPTMLVVGENDPSVVGNKKLAAAAKSVFHDRADQSCMVTSLPGADAPTTVLLVRNGDHSLRYNSSSRAQDKDRASTSLETLAMNQAVAVELSRFFAGVAL